MGNGQVFMMRQIIPSAHAQARMDARGLTLGIVRYVIEHAEYEYKVRSDIVSKLTLPSGEIIKVRRKAASANPYLITDVILVNG